MFSVQTCPGGWAKGGEFCYLFVREKKTWQNASNQCMDKGGYLTSIHNKEENDFLLSKFLLIIVLYNFDFFI